MKKNKNNDKDNDKDKNPWVGYFSGSGLLVGVSSMWASLTGLEQITGELKMALPLTIASGCISVVVFTFIYAMIPNTRPDQLGRLLLTVAIPALLVVASTSTTTAAYGLAAPAAQQRDMVQTVDEADEVLQELLRRQENQSTAIALLEAKAVEFTALAETERKDGRFGGQKGKRSKAAQDLDALARAFTLSAEQVREDDARRKGAAEQAQKAVGKLRSIADSTQGNAQSLRDSAPLYTQQLRQLSQALTTLERSIVDQDVLAPVDAALSQQASSTVKSKKKEVQEQQIQAAEAIAKLATEARDHAQGALTELQFEPLKHARFEFPSALDALLEHFWHVAHMVAFPVGLDLGFPLVVIFALTFMRDQRLDDQEEEDERERWETGRISRERVRTSPADEWPEEPIEVDPDPRGTLRLLRDTYKELTLQTRQAVNHGEAGEP